MNPVYEKLMRCYEAVKPRMPFQPEIALVLGSGLGGYADRIRKKAEISYSEIEGFPVSTAPGHAGRFVFGYIEDVPAVIMQGRVHYYEGYSMQDVVLPARLMGLMGAKVLFLTNAAGGIQEGMKAGDLMLITGHISTFVPSPLIGENIDELGVRFPDMSHVYDRKLQSLVRDSAKYLYIPLKEGVYAQTAGPNYETPEEVQMLKMLGADAVGMSTAVEAIAGVHMGMKVCGISCITNLAAGLSSGPLSHQEVQESADSTAPLFEKLITESVCSIHHSLEE